jgi:uncharacterized membrane-anchored protein
MKMGGLPRIDARYWILMLLASVCGTNLGDFASQTLNLGFIGGFGPFAVIFAVMLAAARHAEAAGEVYYWVAIVVARAGATDIADLATHQLRLEYPPLAGAILALLVAVLLAGAWGGQTTVVSAQQPDGQWDNRPVANATYWAAMITASVFGTVSGDFVAGDLGLGAGYGALATTMLAALIVRDGRLLKPWYWVTVIAVRTAATNLGDYVASDEGLNAGFLLAGLCVLALLLGLIAVWRSQPAPRTVGVYLESRPSGGAE